MNEPANLGSTATANVEQQDVEHEEGVASSKYDPQSWQTLVTRGVPSLGAIAVTFLLAPPDWVLQIITNGGGTCTHNNGC